MGKQYYVYILMNRGGTALYVGVTNDLARRVDQHASGVGAEHTTRYATTRLVYFETFEDVRFAIAREKQIKSWRREKKENLIRSMNPRLENLRLRLQ